jgi:hypothetical protein
MQCEVCGVAHGLGEQKVIIGRIAAGDALARRLHSRLVGAHWP